MAAIAEEAKVKPTRVSFTAAISLIDTQLRWLALPPDGKLLTKLKQMRADIRCDTRNDPYPSDIKLNVLAFFMLKNKLLFNNGKVIFH